MYRFEKIVEGVLSMFREPELWDSVPAAVLLAEKITARIVNNMYAESGKYTNINLSKNVFC